MLAKLCQDIFWFRTEIAVCEEAIREVESDAFYGPSKDRVLARMRATLDSHRESLADLEEQLVAPAGVYSGH